MRPWLTHYVGQCNECGEMFVGKADEYNSVRRRAKKHAERTGHKVGFETGYATIFEGEDGESP